MGFAAFAADKTIRNLRGKLCEVTLSNDVAYFNRIGCENIQRTSSTQILLIELRIARQTLWDNITEDRGLCGILVALFGLIMYLHLTEPIGTPIFCIFAPTIVLCVSKLGLKSSRLNTKVETKQADFLSFINERIRDLNTLKAFVLKKK